MSYDRQIFHLEKQISDLKVKLDNAIIDIRAVNFWGWTTADKEKWDVIRHEIQYKRQGFSEWISIPVVQRDLNEYTQITLSNGELDE